MMMLCHVGCSRVGMPSNNCRSALTSLGQRRQRAARRRAGAGRKLRRSLSRHLDGLFVVVEV